MEGSEFEFVKRIFGFFLSAFFFHVLEASSCIGLKGNNFLATQFVEGAANGAKLPSFRLPCLTL